eukprot:2145497-Rhodomonas_salina.1
MGSTSCIISSLTVEVIALVKVASAVTVKAALELLRVYCAECILDFQGPTRDSVFECGLQGSGFFSLFVVFQVDAKGFSSVDDKGDV